MASVLLRARESMTLRVALAVEDGGWASDVERVLARRGAVCQRIAVADAVTAPAQVVALAPREAPGPAEAAALAPLCASAAVAGRPVVILTAFPRALGSRADAQAAALAYLRAHGAILCPDPDAWLETLVLLAAFGLPPGPRVAVVAPPRSWISSQAQFLANEASSSGGRFAPLLADAGRVGPTDVVLIDRDELEASRGAIAERSGAALLVPVVGRAELSGDRPALVGLRAALAAAGAAGRLRERLEAGLGPADPAEAGALEPDRERERRQLDRLGARAGDHETKVLLAAWGVPVTRQAVATTPSAATRLAKRAGYPVEIKPWGPDVPSELEGCPVERGLETAADVRRAFAAVARDLGLPAGAAVIVRETPPAGRELRARVAPVGELGLMVVIDVVGAPGPVAAPAPLRPIDAEELARHVEASRLGDPQPDRAALADLLRRASFLVATSDRVESLELTRVITATRSGGAVVADARAELT
ncbi:MAG TPA: acetate--CoA ligase family protein [Kofleriaceae bacterium]|nr:acetate--CoA ligase family protein [Kofleriaceae bacterium]